MANNRNNARNNQGGDDIVADALARMNALMEVLSSVDVDSRIRLSEDGLPYLMAEVEDRSIRFFALPADDDNNRYILEIGMVMMSQNLEEDEVGEIDPNIVLACEEFNADSVYGYAVYSPAEGIVELRAQSIEERRPGEGSRYLSIIGLLFRSMVEFVEKWEEIQAEE